MPARTNTAPILSAAPARPPRRAEWLLVEGLFCGSNIGAFWVSKRRLEPFLRNPVEAAVLPGVGYDGIHLGQQLGFALGDADKAWRVTQHEFQLRLFDQAFFQ